MKTTIVTALFDIERDKWSNFTMSYHTYLAWMKNMLTIDQYIIIYTEQKFYEKVVKMRKEVDPQLSKTKIHVVTLKNSKCDELWGKKIREVMSSKEFQKDIHFPDVPEMCKPWYNILMYSKIYWLELAMYKNPFKSNNFMWMDAGTFRDHEPDVKNKYFVDWPVKKIDKPTFFCHHDTIKILDKKQHSLSQMRFIHGTCFIIPKKYFEDFKQDFEYTIEYMLSNNFVGSDEKVLDLVYLQNTNSFELIKCGWREYFEQLA